MKLNDKQLEQVQKACSEIEYGSVTIKMNATSNYVDIIIEKQVRVKSEEPVTKFNKG